MDYKPLILVLLLATRSFAQTAFDPLTIGIGARALGMGSAYAAAAEDGDALFNNPAGLGEIDAFKFTSMGGSLLEDVNYTVLGGIYPLGGQSSVGLGLAGAYTSGVELRDSAGTLSGKANFGSYAGILAFGKKIFERTSLGINLKYYLTDGTENDGGDGSRWGADVGLIQKGTDWLSLGVVAQNIPRAIRAGAKLDLLGSSYQAAIFAPWSLAFSYDTRLDLEAAQAMTSHGGIEFSPGANLTLRAGYDQNKFTSGLTFKFAGLGFHYAYNLHAQFFSIAFDERGWPPEGPPGAALAKR